MWSHLQIDGICVLAVFGLVGFVFLSGGAFCLVAVVLVLVLFHPCLLSYKRYEAHVGLSERALDLALETRCLWYVS